VILETRAPRESVGRLEVLVTGRETATSAAPILFVHGTGHGAWCWRNFSEYFAAAGYATYAVSLRGHAGSAGAAQLREATVADYVNDVRRVAESLDAAPIIFGHSLGGRVVQRYLQQYDAAAAVLIGPSPVAGMLVASWRIGFRRPIALLRCLVKRDFAQFYRTVGETHDMLYLATTPRAQVETFARRVGPESFRAAAEMLWPLTGRRSFDCPLLVIGGAEDRVVPVKHLAKTADALGATLIVLENAAHAVMVDHGWEEAARRIAEWLDRCGLGSAEHP
jgi:pimeloyl-ACP methyl ester carboxylesterase